MREINKLIVHCSATKPSMDIGVEEIRRWHVEDNGWSDIGYHAVIRRSGDPEHGRRIESIGAHAQGYNLDSIGVCLVGGIDEDGNSSCNFTSNQYEALSCFISTCKDAWPEIKVIGHNQISDKDCPCFDVESFVEGM